MSDNRWGPPRSDGSYATWGLPYPVTLNAAGRPAAIGNDETDEEV